MFSKVLIANRGVISRRVTRTLRRLGVGSVAVYSEADADSLHVRDADESVLLGPPPVSDSYLQAGKILEAAARTGAQAIHPGYGFLSENAAFAEACEAAGVAFIGPTPEQMRLFGLKHTARELAEKAGVPLLKGTGLLADVEAAVAAAEKIGFPVMLKSTAGGGGIGMKVCSNVGEICDAFASIQRLGASNFKDSGVFLEQFVARARHIEVQLFGDGNGRVLALGERDCSAQRRNQKVIEETPAPGISDEQRTALYSAAVRLGESVNYRSAGTVEFVLDADTGAFFFLEVNTRLQVEHGVTEEVWGVDLVEWMVRLAAGETEFLDAQRKPQGHSIQVRIYAEDPAKNFQPSCGLLTEVCLPSDIRCETWLEAGLEVTPFYDPMLAKIIVHADSRAAALGKMRGALDQTTFCGVETNRDYLRCLMDSQEVLEGKIITRSLSDFQFAPSSVDVIDAGAQTTVQDYPGRLGYWAVGVPPSGPIDSLAHRIANRLLGNDPGDATLELVMSGPTLKFNVGTTITLCGADFQAQLNGQPLPLWKAVPVKAGSVLVARQVRGAGARAYLAVAGGWQVPKYLGSRATFTLGKFGGHGGRGLRPGDVLHVLASVDELAGRDAPAAIIPEYGNNWKIGVLYGPHGAPDFFTDADMEMFFGTAWRVHYNSNRTGIRLIGPKPQWARQDGGEAGLHPSNIHDNAYAIGAIDFTGDMPIILGPDGPSLGGFVCPATIVECELWKMGQLKAGDTVTFVPISLEEANRRQGALELALETLKTEPVNSLVELREPAVTSFKAATEAKVGVVYRRAGDANLLVEYGPLVLDLALRFRVHALMEWLEHRNIPGIIDLTPGIRSLQIHYNARVLSAAELMRILQQAEEELPDTENIQVPSRIVHLPLSWDDPATQLAIQKYMQSVRPDAPWCPSNLEFIRRINGLESIEEVREIVFSASYLVLGLGDVYLGAPVATPLDPRHRLVTTKYNPARTWTPENAVGIGGAYMCIYGMEGPGGYQFVGRTVQVWNSWRSTANFSAGKPWLLRFFDQIRFYPVSGTELLRNRADFLTGKFKVHVEEQTFCLRSYREFLDRESESIQEFRDQQRTAFSQERERWAAAGQDLASTDVEAETVREDYAVPEGSRAINSPLPGSIWEVLVEEGSCVAEGDKLVIVESMKMETAIVASCAGRVTKVLCSKSATVEPGQMLVVIEENR